MNTYEFCEECEVYHNLVWVNGVPAFMDCEKRINENYNQQIARHPYDSTSITRHDLTPNSKTSFTSINNHLLSTPTR